MIKYFNHKSTVAIFICSTIFLFICSCSNNSTGVKSKASRKVLDMGDNYINVPKHINSIASMSPATTDIIIALGLYDKLVLVDNYSHEVEPSIATNENIIKVDMLNPNIEIIIKSKPDIVLISDINYTKDRFDLLETLGITVVNIPTNNRLEQIDESIQFAGRLLDKENIANTIANKFNMEIENIKHAAENITNKQSIYFEMESPPNIYTFGNGVFMNDIINLIGGKNIFKNENAWIKVSEESIIDKNPDIIIAFDRYCSLQTDSIANRAGWKNINAVKNNRIYFINNHGQLSRTTHNIIEPIKEIAKYIYPDIYSNLK